MATFDPYEELAALATRYHHLQSERGHDKPTGRVRRAQRAKAEAVRAKFESVLARWVPDDELRAQWRARLDHHAEVPAEPHLRRPTVWKGRTEAGAVVDIRPAKDGRYDVTIDGQRTARLTRVAPHPAQQVLSGDGGAAEELFDASPDAQAALVDYVRDPSQQPPWRYARELAEDGLIDADFGLTARGHRLLARVGQND